MSESFDVERVDRITTGAVGEPGQRVFYLQAVTGSQVISLKLEKTQVAALVRYLEALLADLRPTGDLPTDLDLVEPVIPEWVVASLGVSYDEVDDTIVLVAEELVDEDEDAAVARFRVTREQIAALAAQGEAAVSAGRPACPMCGNPLDPEGHVCPRLNGHKAPTS